MALHHLAPGEILSLQNAARSRGGAALVKTDRFEAVQLVLEEGRQIAAHSVPGHCTIHCVEGSATLNLDEPMELSAGDWLYLDRGQAHSLSAAGPARLLVTIMFD